MTTHSTDGRKWAALSKLKAGDKVLADGGFTCIKEGAVLEVEQNGTAGLFVPCTCGAHYLDGQLSDVDHDHLVGLWPA